MEEDIVSKLIKIDIGNYNWQSNRRFLIPKSQYSYRVSTQLDPIDSIMISAILYQFGKKIEEKRDVESEKRVFSYRFSPTVDGGLYKDNDAWKKFWKHSLSQAKKHKFVIYIDIADFYNQIYHHIVENQLISCGFPNEAKKSIISLLESCTQGVSRGIPIGPHFAHILAEMTLIPIDSGFKMRKYEYCRYSDDILIFCDRENDATKIIYEVANMLDKQQRLMMQKQKTRVFTLDEFEDKYLQMLNDNPISNDEREILAILSQKTSGNPYAKINIKDLDEEERSKFSEEALRNLVELYLEEQLPNYSRLRWFYRRLSQVGTDNAIEVTIENFERLIPAISDICHYFISAVSCSEKTIMHKTGNRIIELLNNEIVKINEFFQISLLSLFVTNNKLNHIDKLIDIYRTVPESLKRKIILASYIAGGESWIRDLKEEENKMELWNKRAYFIACSILPRDEKKYYLKRMKYKVHTDDIMTQLIIRWSLQQ
ncbi:RNA-directed DNA polymerase [Vallitalea pronyensis]|uniref:RNA-directed DNA polymerase n=1 Tax=Vallitalea pronyensis TaxID=1348613 RepID=A0A8J8SET9_9FIRM|nr:RNA-directed DNA polymerase [Vallitalea pronyensis]QUI20890.1 RNA-directed DNA polymerase [Vallitalea pronyensis]